MCIRDRLQGKEGVFADYDTCITISTKAALREMMAPGLLACLLYTSDAADERSSVDLGGRRIIKKKTRLR